MKYFPIGIILLSFISLSITTASEQPDVRTSINSNDKIFAYISPSIPPFRSHWDNAPEFIKGRNFFKRLESFYRYRENEQGYFPIDFINMQKEIEVSKITKTGKNLSNQWVSVGPIGVDMASSENDEWGILSGRVRGLAVHPYNPNIIFIGAASGGIWKSTNGGSSWVDKSGYFNMITFGSIVINPDNPDIMYAGTGEALLIVIDRFYSGDGLYKSTDAGETWFRVSQDMGEVTHFTDLEISPHNPSVLLASTVKNAYNPMPNHGLWRSTNSGLNWIRVMNLPGIFDVAFNPEDSDIAYAALGAYQQQSGFFISTDGGINFTRSNIGLPSSDSIGRIQFDISASNPSVIYSVIYNDYPGPDNLKTKAFKSTDGGHSWQQISKGVNISGSYDGVTSYDQGNYDLCIAVNPVNQNNVYYGNVEMSRTLNGSNITFVRDPNGLDTGRTANSSYVHLDIHNIKFSPSNPEIIYIGCDGGIYKSTNSGLMYTHINNGINTMQLYRIGSHHTNRDILISGAQDNGGNITYNRGSSPWEARIMADGMESFTDYSNPDVYFIGSNFGTLSRSTDGGLTFSEIVQESPDSSIFTNAPYWQHPYNPEIIYGGYKHKIYKSTDKGSTWNFTTTASVTKGKIVSATQSVVNPNNIIVVSYIGDSSIMRSSDGGYSWTNITHNVSGYSFGFNIRVVSDPLEAGTFYLLRNSYTNGQVIKTTDFGNTWSDKSSNLPKIPVNDIFVDPMISNNIYLANDFGVYLSSNKGGTWDRMNNDLPIVPVLDFDYFNYYGARLLRIATYGRGGYEYDLGKTTDIIPEKYSISQNYPNPFNPGTKFVLSISNNAYVSVLLFDLSGREIDKIIDNEYRSAGNYTINYVPKNLSTGVYFYKLIVSNFSDSKKMIYIK